MDDTPRMDSLSPMHLGARSPKMNPKKSSIAQIVVIAVCLMLLFGMLVLISGCDSSVGRFKLLEFEDVRVGIKDVTTRGKDGSSVGVTNSWGKNAGRGDGSGRAARD